MTQNQKEDLSLLNKIKDDYTAENKLLEKYKNLAIIKSRAYFLIGGDFEDLIQEGMIGLFKAINEYKVDENASFETFASLCIERQILTAIKKANRQKHIPLNTSFSLDEIDHNIYDFNNPENLILDKESETLLLKKIANVLSKYELKVLELYLNGKSYEEIALKLNKNEKSIDNALQRIRKKIDTH